MKERKWTLLLGIYATLVAGLILHLTAVAKAASSDPIKIGVLVPQTGPQTQHGSEVKWGLTIAFDEVGWKIAGRDVKLIVEDDELKPSVALQKARKLVESDGVAVLTGVVSSAVALSLRPYVLEKNIPLIISVASADVITRENPLKQIFRTSFTASMEQGPLAAYAYRELGYRTVFMIAPDYVAGHEMADWFKHFFQQLGGKVVGEVYPPLGTTDFAPYFGKIRDVDAVWSFEVGSDGIQFVKQYDEYGLKKKIPSIGSSATWQGYQVAVQKDSAVGAICSGAYSVALNTPENQKFLKAYQKKLAAREPDSIAVSAYDSGQVIIEGIKNTKGDIKDVSRLIESFGKVRIISPRGPLAFDKRQNAICNIYIEKVVKRDGRYTKDIIYTYKDVHQDWNP